MYSSKKLFVKFTSEVKKKFHKAPGFLSRRVKAYLYLAATALLMLGMALVLLGNYDYNALLHIQVTSVSIPEDFMVLGLLFIILAIVGYALIQKEKLSGLIVYAIAMVVLLIALIGVGGGAFTNYKNIDERLTMAWITAPDSRRNAAQTYFHCCGWNESRSLPGSNCVVNGTQNTNMLNCEDLMTKFVQTKIHYLATAAIVTGACEFMMTSGTLYLILRIYTSVEYLEYCNSYSYSHPPNNIIVYA